MMARRGGRRGESDLAARHNFAIDDSPAARSLTIFPDPVWCVCLVLIVPPSPPNHATRFTWKRINLCLQHRSRCRGHRVGGGVSVGALLVDMAVELLTT